MKYYDDTGTLRMRIITETVEAPAFDTFWANGRVLANAFSNVKRIIDKKMEAELDRRESIADMFRYMR